MMCIILLVSYQVLHVEKKLTVYKGLIMKSCLENLDEETRNPCFLKYEKRRSPPHPHHYLISFHVFTNMKNEYPDNKRRYLKIIIILKLCNYPTADFCRCNLLV